MEYALMNKNEPVFKFIIEGKSPMEYLTICEHNRMMPNWMITIPNGTDSMNLQIWLQRRNAVNRRESARRIAVGYKLDDLRQFLKRTHAVSLNDTLWVRTKNEKLVWADVSPYQHEFDETMAGNILSREQNGTLVTPRLWNMPELTTEGRSDKSWVREDGRIRLQKREDPDTSRGPHPNLRRIAECIASPIYEHLCGGIHYDLKYDETTHSLLSVCDLFTTERIGFVSAEKCRLEHLPLKKLLEKTARYAPKTEEHLRAMLVADCVCQNTGRNYRNFGFAIDNGSFEILGMSPVFNYSDSFDTDPDERPLFGTSWVSTARSLLTPDIRSELKNLKDLKLDPAPGYPGIEQADKIKNRNIDRILGKTKTVGFLTDENE